jgi:hypothetical protein
MQRTHSSILGLGILVYGLRFLRQRELLWGARCEDIYEWKK